MFNSILSGELTLVNFLICIGVAFVLGLIVAFVHSKTLLTTDHGLFGQTRQMREPNMFCHSQHLNLTCYYSNDHSRRCTVIPIR